MKPGKPGKQKSSTEHEHHAFLAGNNDFEVRSLDAVCVNESELKHPWWYNFKYLITGMLFGIVLVKSEVISWFRIQEMFRLQNFHMYGVIGSAIAVGALSIYIIKKYKIRTIYGEPIEFPKKSFSIGQVWGGLLFGLGWALTGACPGPLYAQIGTGVTVTIVTLFSAIAGTWVYGLTREKLPH
ncbi:MAG TPA: YeeE/YedE thiosulfate transporter family protein [Ferruginibacter sp.]|nr:YeeE/YedE thiosulfate transporter family protein [Ferruginibacter sp.]